jgi:hypothetical protein
LIPLSALCAARESEEILKGTKKKPRSQTHLTRESGVAKILSGPSRKIASCWLLMFVSPPTFAEDGLPNKKTTKERPGRQLSAFVQNGK